MHIKIVVYHIGVHIREALEKHCGVWHIRSTWVKDLWEVFYNINIYIYILVCRDLPGEDSL